MSLLFSKLQGILPQHLLSRLAGYISNCQHATVKNWIIETIIKRYQIDLSDALETDHKQYRCFNDFFTRQLKPEARPIDSQQNSVVSPADGILTQFGTYQNDQLIQAKGRFFSAIELLGGEFDEIAAFKQGQFATVYLSPRDYHRVHMPADGTLIAMTHIPGQLFSVNQQTSQHIPNLFARNERVACFFETAFGPMAVVFVGAMLVASIVTNWHGTVSPPTRQHIQHWDYLTDQQHYFDKGQEIGHFKFGSTAIVLLPKEVRFDQTLIKDSQVQMGQKLATY